MMEIEIFEISLLILAGCFAGFINTLAGSGSLITLPLLIFLGLSPHQANATNRVAIFFQNIVAVRNFEKQKLIDYKASYPLILSAVAGSIAGALFAVNINEYFLNIFIGCLLFSMFFVVLFKPDRWVKEQAGKVNQKSTIARIIIFFMIGVYGGFIQAGVGFFLLAGLVLGAGFDLIKGNAVKVLIVLSYTTISLIIFIWSGHIHYLYGIILAIGNASGAYIASRFAIKIGVKFIRYILLLCILMVAVKVSWDIIFTYSL